ncbi:Uncharacterised protein [Salmonella enterica subsp. arizonae]|uniref:Uncharacterized protein n=1 Tax=Salmonella enterica subsp. arizonae TaxID=59203 RepID=A0A2X4TZ34_SALER|nr:Uncharacterised protein [Salmonella enterica subsp. arizonae]
MRPLTTWFPMTLFHLLERGIEAGCTGRTYQMPENPHRNRVTHDMFLIIFWTGYPFRLHEFKNCAAW